MKKDCYDQCGDIASQRLRYFTGRHLTARDLRDEQAHHRSHRYLHNRMLHGWGVVCGLHVHPHRDPHCATNHVRVDCGFAMDCCGRELPLEDPQVPPPIDWNERPDALAEACYYPLLCLEYCESEIERVPVLYSEQDCDPQRRESSRYQESVRFVWRWVLKSELPKYHWKIRGGGYPEHGEAEGGPDYPPDDCDDPETGPTRCCLEPQCPPHRCVPLAFIQAEPNQQIGVDDILMLGRPTLEPPKHALTHICEINWPHGGIISRHHLEHLRELRVRFDRRLHHSHHHHHSSGGPRGVNSCTFVVQFGGEYEDLDFVTSTHPLHLRDRRVAVFTIDPRSNGPRRDHHHPYAYLENQTVFITLKCDFLLDCHGVAVDGNHLGGVLPSGDGVPGGTFESWFRVLPDGEFAEYEKRLKEQAQTE